MSIRKIGISMPSILFCPMVHCKIKHLQPLFLFNFQSHFFQTHWESLIKSWYLLPCYGLASCSSGTWALVSSCDILPAKKTVSLLHTQKKQHKPPKVVHSVYTMTPFQLGYIVVAAKDICIDWFQFCCPALEKNFKGYCQSKRDMPFFRAWTTATRRHKNNHIIFRN